MDDLRPSDPAVVGRYQTTARLGAGGMGVVYLAEGPRGRVALKLVRPELGDDPSFRARFRREVQSSFRVSSTHTAKLIDFDTEADQPWMATEFVDGPSLDELVRDRGPLGHADQLALATGLAQALVAIHDFDVIHRDLKPANILLTASGPKVIDFGIAAAADAARITSSGLMVGSPGWLAPEQIEAGDATPASDVFSFSLVLCFAASGEPPFGTGGTDALLFRAMNAPPNVPLDKLARQLHRPVLAAIARDPARRPSASDLLGFMSDAGVATTTVVSRELLAPGRESSPPAGGVGSSDPTPPPAPRPDADRRPSSEWHTRAPGTPPPPVPPPPGPVATPAGTPSGTHGFGGGTAYPGWQPPPSTPVHPIASKRRPGWVIPAAAAAGVAVVAGVIVAVVLSSGGSSTRADPTPVPSTSSGTPSPSPSVSPSTTPSPGSQSALTAAALLTADDFPARLKSAARTGVSQPCNGAEVKPPAGTELRGLINNGVTGGNIVNETVAVLPSESAAADLFDQLRTKIDGCTTYSSVYDGTKTDKVVVSAGPAGFGAGDDSVYYTETFTPQNYEGSKVSAGTALVRQGRVVIRLVTAYGSQVDPAMTKELAQTLAGRVESAG